MSAVVRESFSRPVPAWQTMPEGPASLYLVASSFRQAPSVYVMIDRGVRQPHVGLLITPREAIRLAEKLTRIAEEGLATERLYIEARTAGG